MKKNIVDLKVTLVQTELVWEDIESNLAAFEQKLDRIQEETHLIVLPEMFSTGFSMEAAKLAQDMNGSACCWLQNTARRKKVDIVASAIIKADGAYYNRLIWAQPGGGLFTYDKRHLFRMAGEEKVYRPGNQQLQVELRGWRIRPFICYDLRFPAWLRNLNNQYDVALFIANWPEKRAPHWKVLLQARAIENQCYVIGVNRVGQDGHGYAFSGDSSVIDPQGGIVFQKSHKPCVHTCSLSYRALKDYREKFPVWMDSDSYTIDSD